MQRKLTVSQLNKYISGVFDDELVLHDVTVCGEVYEFRRYGARTFMTLREGDCTLQCATFGTAAGIAEGMNVEALGTVTFYARTGRVSFVIEDVTPSGDGKLLLELLALKEKLKSEGLFENRPPLPEHIKKAAVITSEYGAVIHDILSVVRSKNPYLDICVCDVRVQGSESAQSIADAVRDINRSRLGIDVIVIARGGGSAYDLSAYNTETVARAVAASALPVVSAVGHETDYTLCDLCASVRAGTPSIAADIISEPVTGKIARLRSLAAALSDALDDKVSSCASRVAYRAMSLVGKAELAAAKRESAVRRSAEEMKDALDALLAAKSNRLAFLSAMLDKSSPLKILSQGYAKIARNGEEITSAAALAAGDRITVRMADGKAEAEVL